MAQHFALLMRRTTAVGKSDNASEKSTRVIGKTGGLAVCLHPIRSWVDGDKRTARGRVIAWHAKRTDRSHSSGSIISPPLVGRRFAPAAANDAADDTHYRS